MKNKNRKKKIYAEPLGRCACGGEIAADAEQGAVTHSFPVCQKYLELEPLEFLVYVRQSRGIWLQGEE
jgi:hypothetical protein